MHTVQPSVVAIRIPLKYIETVKQRLCDDKNVLKCVQPNRIQCS